MKFYARLLPILTIGFRGDVQSFLLKVHTDNFPHRWDQNDQQIKFVLAIFVVGHIMTISVQLIGILISGNSRREYSLKFLSHMLSRMAVMLLDG